MKISLLVLTVLTFSVIYISCTNDKLSPVEVDCSGETPTWDGEVDALVAATCAYAGCHISGTSAPGNYITYNGINSILRNGSFKNRVFDIKDNQNLGMPPAYADGPKDLTAEQLRIFSCWMEAGFPEN